MSEIPKPRTSDLHARLQHEALRVDPRMPDNLLTLSTEKLNHMYSSSDQAF